MARRVRGGSTGCICTDTTAASVRMEPTERSKLLLMRTTTTPIATIPTIDTWRRILRRFPVVRKLEEVVASSTITATSTNQTHSRPTKAKTRLTGSRRRMAELDVGLESKDIAAHHFLACLLSCRLGDQTPVAHYQDTIAQQQDLREL